MKFGTHLLNCMLCVCVLLQHDGSLAVTRWKALLCQKSKQEIVTLQACVRVFHHGFWNTAAFGNSNNTAILCLCLSGALKSEAAYN